MTHFPPSIDFPDAIFWDWDGTLADSYSFLNDAHNHTLTTLGFEPFKQDEYKQYFGKPREILYPAIYKEKCDEAMEVFQTYVFDNSHKVQTIEDTQSVLEFFKAKDILMGVVTNKKGTFVSRELKHTKYDQYFSVLVGAGEAENDKPSAAPLNLALDKSGLSTGTHTIWYVGDTENDLACAKEAGCPALFLKGEENTNELIRKYTPLISFDNYAQLREFLVAI